MRKPRPPAPPPGPSRRAVLGLAGGALAAGTLAAGAPPAAAQTPPNGKYSKAVAGYLPKGGPARCQDCSAYNPGTGRDNGTCAVVEGIVAREGWCNFFDA